MMRMIVSLLFLSFLTQVFATEQFDINRFSDPARYGWKTYEARQEFRQDLIERQKLLQIYQMKAQPISANVIKSAIVPGWGHFAVQDYTKGQVLLGIEIVLMGSSILLYDQAMENYGKYKHATQIDDIEKYYNDALSPYQFSLALLGLYSLVWAYGIFDTAQSTEKYNAEVWQKTMKEYGQKVRLTPTGVEVKF